MPKITPIILAGGTGTRLWPMSRRGLPKQFLPLFSDESTYQATLRRVSNSPHFVRPVVITNEDYRFHAASQAAEVGVEVSLLLEPIPRDSGPAIAAAASFAQERDGDDALVLILAADHIVLDKDEFVKTCLAGAKAASGGKLVTFGINPTEPNTSFGYIKPANSGKSPVSKVEAFVEKPDLATAARYVAEGYLWNSGNFLFRSDVLASELSIHAPDVLEASRMAVQNMEEDLTFKRIDPVAFEKAPKISIDYCLMEPTDAAAVVRASYRWSDVGNWDAFWEMSQKDDQGNATKGSVALVDTKDCVVWSDRSVVGLVGAENLIVTVTSDAVLVAHRSAASKVKELVAELKAKDLPQAEEHRLVRRPWGSYDSVDEGERFKVKRIVVTPGASLSLQRHVHRAEHWVVVRGVAEVTVDKTVTRLSENQSIYIPQGSMHRLKNPGKIPLELIEVQTGSYLGEDDIQRFDDDFGRAGRVLDHSSTNADTEQDATS